MGSSTILAISLGIAVGKIKASGVAGRTFGFTTCGAAKAIRATGGGAGGGGGPIGDTRVINSSRSEIDWGRSSGMISTITINKP
jgi:hypothetical protein